MEFRAQRNPLVEALQLNRANTACIGGSAADASLETDFCLLKPPVYTWLKALTYRSGVHFCKITTGTVRNITVPKILRSQAEEQKFY